MGRPEDYGNVSKWYINWELFSAVDEYTSDALVS